MAVDKTPATFPSYVASFNSSGNWTASQSTNKIYVAIKGSTGGAGPNAAYNSGTAVIGGGYVSVSGGATYSVVIGAVGNQGVVGGNCVSFGTVPTRYSSTIGCLSYNSTNAGNTGGTTTWDTNAIIVYGSQGGQVNTNGSAGSASFETSLPQLYPTGAVARVSGTSSANSNVGAGQAFVFTVS